MNLKYKQFAKHWSENAKLRGWKKLFLSLCILVLIEKFMYLCSGKWKTKAL